MKSKTKIFSVICLSFFLLISIQPQSQVDSLKELLVKSDEKQKLKLLIKIGYYLSSENPREAIEYLDDAIALADEIKNRWNKADAIFNKGVALWHLGKIGESDKYYDQAIKIYEEFMDSLSLIKVFNSQAINYQMRGNVDLAFNMFLKSLDFAKKVGDKPTILNTLLNIGVTYDNSGDYENCLKYYNEALLYADENDKASLALLQSYLAEVYLTLKNTDKAEEYLIKAIENSKLSNDSNSLIWAYSSLGNIQLDKKNYKSAEDYFKKSLNLARNTDYKLEIIHTLTDLGKYYNHTKNFTEAEKYLKEASELAEELSSLTDISNINGELASLYYNMGNYKKAYEFRLKYKKLSDSLFIVSNNEKIAEIQTKHELKQKEGETVLLKHENELQKKIIDSQKIIAFVISLLTIAAIIFIWLLFRSRNKILKARDLLLIKKEEIENNQNEINEKNKVLAGLNATKDKFFSIIAHDLRNPIAAFVNISELLEHDYDKISEEDKKEIIGQMGLSSKNLIRLLENLLTWARLSNDKIDVYPEKSLLSDIVEASIHPYLQSAQNKKIRLNINVPNTLVINTDKFIFQTIIGNVVSNAIKFSNQHSEIKVELVGTDGKYTFSVKDQGIGIEESQLRNLFILGKISTGSGTMGESGTGLGLVLVKELVDKLNWQIEVKSKENSGSEFIVTIPNSDIESS